MPKRPPTPDVEPDTKLLAIYYPYPALPRLDTKGLEDAKEMARWIACICDKDDVLSIYYRPKSPNTVVVEIAGNSEHFRNLLGVHYWKDCFKKLETTELDMVSKIYFSTFSTHRHLEKLGWKLIDVKEDWFKKFDPKQDRQVKYPYPVSSYCDVPAGEDSSSTNALFRHLPVEFFPQATLREMAVTVGPPPTVGTQAWAVAHGAPRAPPPAKGTDPTPGPANPKPKPAPARINGNRAQLQSQPITPASASSGRSSASNNTVKKSFPSTSQADAYASIFGKKGSVTIDDSEYAPMIDYGAEDDDDDGGWLMGDGPSWDIKSSPPSPPASPAKSANPSSAKGPKQENDSNKPKKKKAAKPKQQSNEQQTVVIPQDKVPLIKEKPVSSPTQVTTIVPVSSPLLDTIDFEKEPIFDGTPSFNWADEVSREEVAKAITAVDTIVEVLESSSLDAEPTWGDVGSTWTTVEVAPRKTVSIQECSIHGSQCKPGICIEASKAKSKNKANNNRGNAGWGRGGTQNRGTAQAGGRGRGRATKK